MVFAVMMMMSAAFDVARAQGTWSTAQLSVARYALAATSVGNVALFAGGNSTSALLSMCRGGGGRLFVVASVLSVRSCCSIAVLFALSPLDLSCSPLQILQMLWIRTAVL